MIELCKRAIALLARREYSKLELRQKLINRGYKPSEVEALIMLLADQGLQSDERYTEALIRQRITSGFGPHRILAELKNRGISDSLVDQYLPQDDAFWWDILSRFCEKKYQLRGLNLTEKNSVRLFRFLMQRGFDSELIYRWIYNNGKLHK